MGDNFIEIAGGKIGEGQSTFIIAEMSANHNHNFDEAVRIVRAAKECGADAIKLQTYTADSMTIDSDKECFQIKHGTLWDGKGLYQLYQEAYTPWKWQPELKQLAEDLGMIWFSTPFDNTAVDFLEGLNVPVYKIASFEITDIPLIEYIAAKGKPVIMSTGIATLADIEEAVNACRRKGNHQIALLKCTSAYPAPIEEANLKTIPNLAETFNTVVGLSDHTLGTSAAIASVALGANIIEKHFIYDRSLGGPDAAFSAEPEEFKAMIKSIREVEKALGEVNYELSEKARKSREFARSLFAVADITAGETLTEKNVRSIRPGHGLHPKCLADLLGKKASRAIQRGTPMGWDLVG